ncbi:hypothetical protein LINPERPRIM_LOCUS16828 [Linum perenne]
MRNLSISRSTTTTTAGLRRLYTVHRTHLESFGTAAITRTLLKMNPILHMWQTHQSRTLLKMTPILHMWQTHHPREVSATATTLPAGQIQTSVALVSDADSNRAEDSDARNDDDECDRFVHEEEMITERGWGSEEDDEHRPDRYPIFCSSRDMEAAEIVIGREFESFAQFKEFCKVNAVKFPVNDKIRCKCVYVKECGFWLSARIRGVPTLWF